MSYAIATILVIATAIITYWLCQKKTDRKYSIGYVLELLALGVCALVNVAIFAMVIWDGTFMDMDNPLVGGILTALFSAAIFEEAGKYIMFRLGLLYRSKPTWFDSVIISAIVAMGFTMVENFLYAQDGNPAVLLRVILPCHFLFGTVMGYYYGKAMITQNKIYNLLAFVVPVLLHFVFDAAPIALINVTKNIDLQNLDDSAFSDTGMVVLICVCTLIAICVWIVYGVMIIKAFKQISKWSAGHELQDQLYPETFQKKMPCTTRVSRSA
ncbi:MAG: PrsW family intramembrane metalloprotease [Butyrivibrio sp.]|nr:PrsW family intramembrane metalloprotease [Butyrivibrio sp.]